MAQLKFTYTTPLEEVQKSRQNRVILYMTPPFATYSSSSAIGARSLTRSKRWVPQKTKRERPSSMTLGHFTHNPAWGGTEHAQSAAKGRGFPPYYIDIGRGSPLDHPAEGQSSRTNDRLGASTELPKMTTSCYRLLSVARRGCIKLGQFQTGAHF